MIEREEGSREAKRREAWGAPKALHLRRNPSEIVYNTLVPSLLGNFSRIMDELCPKREFLIPSFLC